MEKSRYILPKDIDFKTTLSKNEAFEIFYNFFLTNNLSNIFDDEKTFDKKKNSQYFRYRIDDIYDAPCWELVLNQVYIEKKFSTMDDVTSAFGLIILEGASEIRNCIYYYPMYGFKPCSLDYLFEFTKRLEIEKQLELDLQSRL